MLHFWRVGKGQRLTQVLVYFSSQTNVFNIFQDDLFLMLENTEICNFAADDTTPHTCYTNLMSY